MHPSFKRHPLLLCLPLFVVLALLLLGLTMRRGLNHDEHQFVASGMLLAHEGLWPYRDYPYFHTPYQALVYAALFRLIESPLLTARLFALGCGLLTLLLLCHTLWARFAMLSQRWRLGLGAGAMVLLATNPLFTYTSGRAWNHDLSLLLALLATVWLLRGGHTLQGGRWFVASGLSLGLAVGTRLSFAPLLAPFGAFLIWQHWAGWKRRTTASAKGAENSQKASGDFFGYRQNFLHPSKPAPALDNAARQPAALVLPEDLGAVWWRRVARDVAYFGVGLVVGVLPMALIARQAPEQFWFGNLGYPRLNMVYHGWGETSWGALLGAKLFFVGQLLAVQPATLLLVLIGLWLGVQVWRAGPRGPLPGGGSPAGGSPEARGVHEMGFLVALLPFLLLGALAPTPAVFQYFYPLVPFGVLIVGYGVGLLTRHPERAPRLGQVWGLVLALTVLLAIPRYLQIANPLAPSTWVPTKLHRASQEMAQVVGDGPVLTLGPIFPLEGQLPIYSAFATGSFAWRVADLLPSQAQQQQGLVAPGQLEAFLAATPPRAILTNLEADDAEDEQLLQTYAQQHGYGRLERSDGSILWLAPMITWGEAIQLGGAAIPPGVVQPGEPWTPTFYLHTVALLRRDLNVLVRLVGPDGREVARDEGWPWGRPTSSWHPGEVWADGHTLTLPPDTAPGYYRLELGFYDPETLTHLPATDPQSKQPLGEMIPIDYVSVGPLPDVPTNLLNPPAQVGKAITLLGAEWMPSGDTPWEGATNEIPPGSTMQVRLFWQARARVSIPYTVFVHLIGPGGTLVAQQDQQPLGGFWPTTRWAPGRTVVDSYTLTIPADAAPGLYHLHVGMYDLATGQRLPVQSGEPIAPDSVRFGLNVGG